LHSKLTFKKKNSYKLNNAKKKNIYYYLMNGCQKNIFKMLSTGNQKKKKKKKHYSYVAFFIAVGGPAAGAVLAPRLAKPEYRCVFRAFSGFFRLFWPIFENLGPFLHHFLPFFTNLLIKKPFLHNYYAIFRQNH
jgi:hypothetical protein